MTDMFYTPDFDPQYKNLSPEIIHAIPKVILNYDGNVEDLETEQVAYAEWIVDTADLEGALKKAEQAPFTLTLLVRCTSAEDVDSIVKLKHPSVVGIVATDKNVAERAHQAWLPYVAEGDAAFEALTPRVTHAVQLFDDFQIAQSGEILPGPISAWIRDRGVPVVCDPRAELAAGAIESMMDHPLPLLRSLGFKATLAGMTTDLLLEVVETLELSIEDLYELTMDAMGAAFIPEPLRQKLIDEQIYPVFDSWSGVPDATPEHSSDTSHTEDNDLLSHAELEGIDPAFLADLGIDPAELFAARDRRDEES